MHNFMRRETRMIPKLHFGSPNQYGIILKLVTKYEREMRRATKNYEAPRED